VQGHWRQPRHGDELAEQAVSRSGPTGFPAMVVNTNAVSVQIEAPPICWIAYEARARATVAARVGASVRYPRGVRSRQTRGTIGTASSL
jgi:hypothetical protein